MQQNYRVLRGQNVYLRVPKTHELEYAHWLRSEEGTMSHHSLSTHLSDDTGHLTKVAPGWESEYYGSVFDRDDVPVGEVSLRWRLPKAKTGEFHVKIARVHQDKGYEKEALRLLLSYFYFEMGGEVMEGWVPSGHEVEHQTLLTFGFEVNRSANDGIGVRMTKDKFRELYDEDEYFMRVAIELAFQSRQLGEDPFGAVLAYNGILMHQSGDKTIQLCDPTAHAEVSLIREYCQRNNTIYLEGYTLYTSTEPCVMCSGAIHWAKIAKVVFSVSQEMLGRASGGRTKPTCSDILNMGHKKVEVVGPFLPDEGLKVYDGYQFVSKGERLALARKGMA